MFYILLFFFFSSRRRHTRLQGDWSSDVCSSDLLTLNGAVNPDFAEVESDAGQFVIDPRQALYFPEKRPFFLEGDRKSTRLNSSHLVISYAVFCLKKKKKNNIVDYHYSSMNHTHT